MHKIYVVADKLHLNLKQYSLQYFDGSERRYGLRRGLKALLEEKKQKKAEMGRP